ncbi:hypothetical protein [Streptomyces sp. NPDC088400]|uniref:hypothetical protein n=1 Tax=Streptomyces sp. NPDC088400 TaxID=3365861 RepID=UPI00381FD04A
MLTATALLVTGCSSEPPRRDDSPIGWKACNELFGSKNVDVLQEQMGGGQLRIENQSYPVRDLTAGLIALARGWEPGSGAHLSAAFNPCQIAISKNGERLTSDVRWFQFSMSEIQSGDVSEEWRNVGGDVLASEDSGRGIEFIFPCKISGTHKGQEEGLPLKVLLWGVGMPNFNTDLRGNMASAMARKLSSELGCVNKPAIPREITLA